MANLWRQAQNSNVYRRRNHGLPNVCTMAMIYINGIPISGADYGSLDRYFSPQARESRERDIEDVEYEDLTEKENDN